MSPEQRARHAALIRSSREDPKAMTRAMRAAFAGDRTRPGQHFIDEVLAEFPDLPEPEVMRRAEALRRAWYVKLSAAGVEARRRNSEAPTPPDGGPTAGSVIPMSRSKSTRSTRRSKAVE
jgi:hypothetical protein